MKRIILIIFITGLLSACAHNNVTSYGIKGTPQTVPLLAVMVSDEGDSSQLKGNDFLRRDIENRIIAELTTIGFKCLPSSDTVTKPSHVLTVASKGMERGTYTTPVTSTPNMAFGGKDISGGNTYATEIIHAEAVLYQGQPGQYVKVAQSYVSGDGQGHFERKMRRSSFGSDKPLSEAYQEIFLQAALSLFE